MTVLKLGERERETDWSFAHSSVLFDLTAISIICCSVQSPEWFEILTSAYSGCHGFWPLNEDVYGTE